MSPGTTPLSEFTIELVLAVRAPDRAAAERIAEDAKKAARQTNLRIRDGRIDNVIVSDVRGEDD